ncbi:hypothetical protein CAEBREN_14734 [Caenorhabditis brenneri]|uniref:Nematode cuticle collagen N-terminal domain-containing protein n=1 Tax=Caenorhabditis brenneri TaxID=135651 RepID=G0PE44_CAEBE|nr:hypothetical protein CAEBREN_14734 [Caenorhabditis brenneri]
MIRLATVVIVLSAASIFSALCISVSILVGINEFHTEIQHDLDGFKFHLNQLNNEFTFG